MGMFTSIVGFKPPDDKWKKMKEVYQSCTNAEVPIPKEVDSFFNYEAPDDAGVTEQLKDSEAVSRYDNPDRAESGIQVDLSKLPEGIKIIRFVNSW